jgi:hypothetical protein
MVMVVITGKSMMAQMISKSALATHCCQWRLDRLDAP